MSLTQLEMELRNFEKGWNILIHTDGHYKFWAFFLNPNGNVRFRWGKIGTYGQEQEVYDGKAYLISKVNEKLNKGYRWAISPKDNALLPESIKVLWEI